MAATTVAILDANNNAGVASFPNIGSEVVLLDPGNYRLCAPSPFSLPTDFCFDFSVDLAGLLDFDASLDAIVSGRGTATLTVSGHPITVDSTALAAFTNGVLTYLDQTVQGFTGGGIQVLGLLPGDYRFCAPRPFSFPTDPCLDFTVDTSGTLAYAPALEGVFNGAGTTTLTVNGFAITLVTTDVAAATLNVATANVVGVTGSLANTGTRVLGLLADDYLFCAPAYPNCLAFSVTTGGVVAYDPSLEGTLTGQGSSTLTVTDNAAPTVDAITGPLAPVDISAQPVVVTATFSDPPSASDTPYSCTVDFNDGTGPQAGTITGMTCSGSNTYAEAGVYTVVVEVTDALGASGSAQASEFIVIYDPQGGFVTGGGWIDSPADACPVFCGGATGKANFGFVSKYKKGAQVPTGNTELNFSAGALNFHSDTYDWLVINQGGTNAQYKGSGSINGDLAPTGEAYKFMVWATDDDPDTFRVKIWYEDNGAVVVYDNIGFEVIGGGNIKIHNN